MVNRKAKGSRGERELVRFFNEQNWGCIRTAGSGSSVFPAPDILAGNAVRRVAVECKVTKDSKKYFPTTEIEQLQEFAGQFGAESWIGVKFGGEQWYFVMPEDLQKTGKHWVLSLNTAKLRGLTKEELVEIKRNI